MRQDGVVKEDLWGTPGLRRYYARQAVREALRSERAQGVYRFATPSERTTTSKHLRSVASLHRAAARAMDS